LHLVINAQQRVFTVQLSSSMNECSAMTQGVLPRPSTDHAPFTSMRDPSAAH